MRPLGKLDGVNQYNAIKSNGTSRRTEFIYNIDALGNENCKGPTEAVRYVMKHESTLEHEISQHEIHFCRKGDFKLIRGCPGASNDWYGLNDYERTAANLTIQDPGIVLSEICECIDTMRMNKTNTYYLFDIKSERLQNRLSLRMASVNLTLFFPFHRR